MESTEPRTSAPGFVESAKRLLATLVAMVHNRLELVATELHEEVARLAGILLWSVAALLLVSIGLGFVALTVLLATPAESRALVAGAIALAFLSAAAASAYVAHRLRRSKPRPFDASLTELEQDHDRLGRGS